MSSEEQQSGVRNLFRFNLTNSGSTMIIKILGNYIEDLPETEEYLTMGFSPSSLPLKKRWKNNGISADFIADYFQSFFVSKYAESNQEEDEILIENLKSTVRYIANELLENAMKFQDEKTSFIAKIFFSLYQDKLVFNIKNGCHLEQAACLSTFIEQKLLVSDVRQLYMEALRNSAKKSENAPSQVGLLSMICDYSAQLGWKFESSDTDPSLMIISTTVCLDIQ